MVVAEGPRRLGSLFYHNAHYPQWEMIYKFAFVGYTVQQGTTHRPMPHLAHLHTAPFLWPRDEQTQQRGLGGGGGYL